MRIGPADVSGWNLADLALDGARIGQLLIRGDKIDWLSLRGARLSSVDLRGLRPVALHGIEGLRGATVDPVTLMDLTPALAEHLGIRVRD